MEKLSADAVAMESRVVHDGQTITSRGPGTAIEFALALVEHLYGRDKAQDVAGAMVYFIFPWIALYKFLLHAYFIITNGI